MEKKGVGPDGKILSSRIRMKPHRKSKGNDPMTGGGKSVRVKVESREHLREMGRKTDDRSGMGSINEKK